MRAFRILEGQRASVKKMRVDIGVLICNSSATSKKMRICVSQAAIVRRIVSSGESMVETSLGQAESTAIGNVAYTQFAGRRSAVATGTGGLAR